MERCERFEELLSQRLDQPLPPQEERELEDHLARCPRCRALAEDLEQLCGQFACLEELPAPEGFARGVMARIRALEPEPAPAEKPEGRKEETEPTEMPKVVPLRRPMPRWARTAAALAACYRSCLTLAREHGIDSVDFPSISTGVYGYPMAQAASVALKAIMDDLRTHDHPRQVRMVCHSESAAQIYPPRHSVKILIFSTPIG